MDETDHPYRPGLRGWWEFLRLREWLADGDGLNWGRLYRLARPSARLRQADQERAYWRRQCLDSERVK